MLTLLYVLLRYIHLPKTSYLFNRKSKKDIINYEVVFCTKTNIRKKDLNKFKSREEIEVRIR